MNRVRFDCEHLQESNDFSPFFKQEANRQAGDGWVQSTAHPKRVSMLEKLKNHPACDLPVCLSKIKLDRV